LFTPNALRALVVVVVVVATAVVLIDVALDSIDVAGSSSDAN
jgi:hypothetical protein